MASSGESGAEEDQPSPNQDEAASVKDVQSRYLRCPSPSFSTMSDRFSTMSDRFSTISGSEAESIFMEPIHLSSAIAAKKIISEELKCRETRSPAAPESLMESADQLMVEDLYNRVKDMMDDRSPYNTPCVLDIQRALVQDRLESPFNPVDEVWPNVYIAEKSVAVNKARLKRLGITHIVNAGHGTGVYTGELFYQGMNIGYMGIEVDDFPEADIAPYFRSCAEFLDDALLTHRGKVLVDSMMGVSRSAVLVAAYLMIFQNMSIMEALLEIRKKRAINPNEGFIKQLRQLNETLMEERDEDDDETLSQCSVIDIRARLQEEGSLFGVKAESIMMDEEEDVGSVMSSVASSAGALRVGLISGPKKPELDGNANDPTLPGKDIDDEDGDVDGMIREWQKRNEKYQNEDWWEAQLMCEGEDVEKTPEDLESVTSEDVQIVRERIRRRPNRPASDSGSTTSCSSYADLWKQRLKEIEEQAAARYRLKEADEDTSSEASQKKIDDDVESMLSDSSSMYNFCKKNKENLTPLERWKVKRIQFGWNKKDESGEQVETETSAPAPTPNLTAYQTWKLKQQKKYGGEEDKDEILEMSRAEDTATIKRRQRREELLERTRKTLEESQSVCGWEAESDSSSIPLSAFCAGAFPSGDDNMSVLSGRSSVLSGRSSRSQIVPQESPIAPAPVIGPNGEPMVNLANIQNWIANVVNETLMQKQTEMMSLAPSRAGSVFSLGRGVDDDKASMLSGSTSSMQSQSRAESVRFGGRPESVQLGGRAESVRFGGRPESVRLGGRAESVLSSGGASNLSSVSGLGSRRSKITTTSVPLYSLFQDQVNLHKLDNMEKEIKSEMRGKMASYEVKKIAEDNKRSTLYKKKKTKEEDDDDDLGKTNGFEDLVPEKPKPKRDYGRSGILNLPTSATSSVDEWLQNVRPPPSKPKPYDGDFSQPPYEDEPSEIDFPSRRSSISVEADEDEYSFASRFSSRHQDLGRDPSPEFNYRRSNVEPSYNGLSEATNHRSYARYEDEESYQSYSAKNKETKSGRKEEEEDEEISAFIAQIKERARARLAEEMEDDEVLSAWRKQEESKSHGHKN
ncbi:serine/threonine/tyrosine-interacting-like protein 2 isoform X2 [Pseudorasbora parva]|uniref:serine/threonine/tyrosine-interacting-like protein 2 isoform X2 n=1 Tax=Pseudorasbora parva TaxID=51549 RepID=UPI00351F612C